MLPGVSKFKRHFFVCQTQRPAFAKPSCGAKGSAQLLEKLMEALSAHPEIWDEVNVTASGCLGPCFDGPSCVVYPEGTWYAPLSINDIEEVIESHLVNGKPVERLIYKWPS